MSTHIHTSTALLTFVDGEHIQDLQILINDREVFNALPGKFERHGIKTLASWPIFVTVVLNESQTKGVSRTNQPPATAAVSGGLS